MNSSINGHFVDVRPGESVLDAGLRAGLVMPYSCRRGSCGTCVARIAEGRVQMPPANELCLSAAAIASGEILMCVARPETAVVIDCPGVRPAEAGDGPRSFVITKLERVTPDVLIMTMAADDGLPVRYVPGQFVNIQTRDFGSRSYSLARPYAPTGLIELHVRMKPGGSFTPWLFKKAQVGDRFVVDQPTGRFQCDKSVPGKRIFVASGTGFAPVKAMLEDLFKTGDRQPKWLYWGGRRPQDIYMDKLARDWTKLHPSFHYVPVVSNALADDEWAGRKGLVHLAALQDHLDMTEANVYACGLPLMVDAARDDFVRLGKLDPDRFHADTFV